MTLEDYGLLKTREIFVSDSSQVNSIECHQITLWNGSNMYVCEYLFQYAFFIHMLEFSCCTTEAIFSPFCTLSFRNSDRVAWNLRIQSSTWARNVEREARRHFWKSGYFLNVTLKLYFCLFSMLFLLYSTLYCVPWVPCLVPLNIKNTLLLKKNWE